MTRGDLLEDGPFTTLAGRDGWLFLASHEGRPVMELYTDPAAVPDPTYQAWADVLRKRHAWFAERGIVHLTVVVPDSCWVYPEMLPEGVRLLDASPAEQLADLLDSEVSRAYLYLRSALVEARAVRPTFRGTDKHWTDWGAFTGDRAIVDALPGLGAQTHPLAPEDVVWDEHMVLTPPRAEGGPTRAETLHSARIERSRCRTLRTVETEMDERYEVVEQDRPELSSAVVFRDSFATAPLPFLSESFRRVSYVTAANVLFRDLVERERPDVVVVELAERRLTAPPPEPTLYDFRTMFGDLLLDDPEAVAAELESRRLFVSGDPEAALQASDMAVVRAPTARVLLHRARVHTALRNPDAVIESLRAATSLDAEDGMAWHMLAQTLGGRGFHQEAATAARRATDAEPGTPQFWRFAASAALRAEDSGAAIRLCREGLRRNPEFADLHYTYSQAMAWVGSVDDALVAAERAVSLDPDSALYRRQLVSVLIRGRRWEHADAALQDVPDDGTDLSDFRALIDRQLGRNGTGTDGEDAR